MLGLNLAYYIGNNGNSEIHERSFAPQVSSFRPFSQRRGRRQRKVLQIVTAVAEAVALTAQDAWVEKTLRTLNRENIPGR